WASAFYQAQCLAFASLPSPDSIVGVAVVVTDDKDAHGVTLNAVEEMTGETLAIGPAQISLDRVKTGGIFQHQRDISHELVEESVAEAAPTNLVIVVEHRRDVALDAPVIDQVHRF